MKYLLTFFLALSFCEVALAEDSLCFPIGRARHDRECYDFDTQVTCLETTDIYSCGWGQRTEEPPSDDDILVCDNSRCPNLVDDYDPEEE